MKTSLILLFFLLIVVSLTAEGQDTENDDPLGNYIREGLKTNLVLQRKNVSLNEALLALKTARSLFFPEANFQMSYQTAEGGRNIPLPLGDLLNGAYAKLNQLTGTQEFPQLNNESINFLPENYYDAKVHTTLPIVNTDLYYNRKIKQQQIVLKQYEVAIYRRELVENIQSAYYSYLSALKAIEIYRSALQLAEEGKRVNQKLLENGEGLPAYVLRANAEIASGQAQLTNAHQQADNARLYFNSLLNRSADASINTALDVNAVLAKALVGLKVHMPVSNREELKSLRQVVVMNQTVVRMNKHYAVPKLNGFLDLGSQSESWKYNDQSRYYMVGFQVNIPLFAAGQNRQKVKLARLRVEDARLNFDQEHQQLEMSVRMASNKLEAAWQTYGSSQVQLKAAESYQRLIDRGYRSGANTYIETVDARNQLTTARMAGTIDKYNVLKAAAELERETASYQFKNINDNE